MTFKWHSCLKLLDFIEALLLRSVQTSLLWGLAVCNWYFQWRYSRIALKSKQLPMLSERVSAKNVVFSLQLKAWV